jgi:hypothetical protein
VTTPVRPERQFGRIHFDLPLPARVGETRVNVLDLALNGARVAGDARFTPAAPVELKFNTDAGNVDAMCTVVRCTLAQFARNPSERSIYQTGLRITEFVGDSDRIVRETIAAAVIRALEEQKANARGIPPIESLLHLDPEVQRFRKCELIETKWRRTETSTSDQPASGFTIAADVPLRYVDLLCETYQRSDEEGRRLTKMLAQLSITRGEGIPTRRYLP